jgi:hypothetical protein
MAKKEKKQVKKKEADVLKLQDLLTRLPKSIQAKETSKGTVLRSGSLYIMHLKQSPKGILYFRRTKTGQHLESNYATSEKDIDALIKKIEVKKQDQVIDEKINAHKIKK